MALPIPCPQCAQIRARAAAMRHGGTVTTAVSDGVEHTILMGWLVSEVARLVRHTNMREDDARDLLVSEWMRGCGA